MREMCVRGPGLRTVAEQQSVATVGLDNEDLLLGTAAVTSYLSWAYHVAEINIDPINRLAQRTAA